MRIDCESCGKALQVPDEKVPDRVFSLTCPGCQNKITVDPTSSGDAALAAPEPAATPAEAPVQAPQEELSATGGHLRSLRSHEMELMELMTPLAFVVDLDGAPDASVDAQLKLAGIKEIRHVQNLAEAVDRVEEQEAGLLVLRMDKAPAPPCEPLDPLYRMPAGARRKTFVALIADNVRTLDGQVAFYLQVNCLINAQELGGMAVPLRRALLFHLKHYRHWWDTQDRN